MSKRTRGMKATLAAVAAAVCLGGTLAPADAAVLVSRYEFEGNTLDSAGT